MNDFEREIIETYREEVKKNNKNSKVLILVLSATLLLCAVSSSVCLYLSHKATLDYLALYDFESTVTTTTTVEQDSGLGGNASFISGDGDIVNGKAESN